MTFMKFQIEFPSVFLLPKRYASIAFGLLLVGLTTQSLFRASFRWWYHRRWGTLVRYAPLSKWDSPYIWWKNSRTNPLKNRQRISSPASDFLCEDRKYLFSCKITSNTSWIVSQKYSKIILVCIRGYCLVRVLSGERRPDLISTSLSMEIYPMTIFSDFIEHMMPSICPIVWTS